MDPLLLARIQFAANITFHILFPTISIALGWALLFFKLRHNRWARDHGLPFTALTPWLQAYRFWVKVFALSFALGVVSGITMSFQFGTNWPGFMQTVGNIAGPLLAYEVLTAFFLEATFLGIMLYGHRRVGNRLHTLATVLVAGGTTLSAFWILVLNSWMHTPAGFELRDGVVHATDWWAVVFNPSLPYRLSHMLIASGLTVAFLIAGVGAYRWRRGDRGDDVRLTMRSGVTVAALLIPLQIVVGDLHGLNTLQHQPAKIAAIESIWQTQKGAPLVLFGLPDEAARETRYAIEIPRLASLVLTHRLDGEIKGLDAFAGQHPPVAPVFFSFRIMVGIGLLMLLVSWVGWWQLRPGSRRLEPSPGLTRGLLVMSFSGWVAVVAGWYTTEIGRQPWLVQGVLSTAQAAGPVPASSIGLTLAVYLALYIALTAAYVATIFHLARKGVPAEPLRTPAVVLPARRGARPA
ncbi:MAG: cytochrome ubiquinol oxidase subunit I [Burkholderiaceae bacterium]|jgi:cytochrome d ubiquinol oxidase subunit I|nr:cytochrome ubiquinol oxidase subunit I [Burkholderiaceae bacterium]